MELKGSLSYSQKSTTGPCHEIHIQSTVTSLTRSKKLHFNYSHLLNRINTSVEEPLYNFSLGIGSRLSRYRKLGFRFLLLGHGRDTIFHKEGFGLVTDVRMEQFILPEGMLAW
jgi:hypothetical protein